MRRRDEGRRGETNWARRGIKKAAGEDDPGESERAGEGEGRRGEEKEVEEGEVQEIDEGEWETNSHFTLGWKIKED